MVMNWKKQHKDEMWPTTRLRQGLHIVIPLKVHDKIKHQTKKDYYFQRVICEIVHWRTFPVPKGRKSKVRFNNRLWGRIVHLSSILKEYGYEQGKYLVIWKKNRVTIWATFLTQAQLDKYFEMIKRGNKEELEKEIYWMTRRGQWDKRKFEAFFGGKNERTKTSSQ
jgi:hypothetical protein